MAYSDSVARAMKPANEGGEKMPYKTGQRIKFKFINLDGSTGYEPAKIARWTKCMGPKDSRPAGYYPVKFDDGATLMVHEGGFTVVE